MKKDTLIKYEQVTADLNNRIYKPIYWLEGDEPYFIDIITEIIAQQVLKPEERDFNQSMLYGVDVDIPSIITTARRFPMMANHQVVIIKEAQNISKIDELITYVENPLNSTILVIDYKYKNLDKRTKLYKEIQKVGVFLRFDKLYDNEIPKWVDDYLGRQKIKITPQASLLLAEFLGTELNKIVNELDKLILTLPKGENTITPNHIETNIGISKDYNNFELCNALGDKDIYKALRITNYYEQNQKNHHIVVTMIALYGYFSNILKYHYIKDKIPRNVAAELRINPFFVKDYVKAGKKYGPRKLISIIGYLREYDVKSKGVGSGNIGQGELFKELIHKIVH